ncbi:hypothetical protein [uncultured Alistipes sp.]|uniref:hypothetical protein n=1 Tax=uncultured Alistipes sp. TaxID=538949 RepID=UPI0025F8E25D|nr:hypothetical protein [uncultured Alistipes sp.]
MMNNLKYMLLLSGVLALGAGCTDEKVYTLPEVYPEVEVPGDVDPPHKVRARPNATSSNWGDYLAYTVDRIEGFTPGQDPDTDKYGGWKVASLSATGFFRMEQMAGRWWMVTPEGNLYISKGVAVFSTGGSDRQHAAMVEKFGTTSEWARQETAMLKDRGFNSLGAWSNVETVRNLSQPTPYTVIVSPMGGLNGYIKSSGEEASASWSGWEGYPNDFACIFHPKFDDYIESTISTISKYKDDPYLIGYFTDNEIPWKQYALDRCLEKWPATHINHIKAQEWLDARKGKTGATLADATDADRRAFIAYCLEYYLEKVTAALKKYDPNHLYLGCRFNQWNYELINDEIFRTAGRYMDVISINHYQKWQPDATAMQNWAGWSGRPFMVTEFYTKGEDSGLPNNTGAGWNVRTQVERGYFYQNFVNELIKSKVCVGWHWFTYMDNDPENMNTDPSNRDSNKGMVTWDFTPYPPLIDNMEAINDNVYLLSRFYDKQ